MINEKIVLNEIGNTVDNNWKEIPNQFSNVELDDYVIMPNHLHGIIIINERVNRGNNHGDAIHGDAIRRDAINCVSTLTAPQQKTKGGITGNKNPQLNPGALSNVLRWFKAKSTHEIRNKIETRFSWQARFYDRIIRDERKLFNVRNYIRYNPVMWQTQP